MVARKDKSAVGGEAGSCSRGPLEVGRRYWDPAGIANARICHSLVGCGQNYTCYTIYMPSYFILLHCSPITMHLPPLLLLLLPRLSAVSFPMPTTHPLISKVLPDLASFSRSRPSRPPFRTHHHHQHPPIRHLIATYIVARNVESYSVSLDSLKQVLMSCTPIPRSSPTAYPLATEHSSGTLVLPSMSHSLARFLVGSSLSTYLSLYFSFPLSHSLPLFPIRFLSHFSLNLRLLQRTVKFAITADTLLMPNWS